MDGRIEYNGIDTQSIDSDILYKSEDSLILVYRKDWTEPPGGEYSDYNKLIVNPTDKRACEDYKINLGDYALAHGYHVSVC